jgi:hypothetical protein
VVVQLPGEHPDRQRKVPAQPDDFTDQRVLRIQAGPRGELDEQACGIHRRERVEADDHSVIECAQVPSARDKHQTAAGTWQEQRYLFAAQHVVQDQQEPPVRQPVPPQRHSRFEVRWDLLDRYAASKQQAGQRVCRIRWLLTWRVPVQ